MLLVAAGIGYAAIDVPSPKDVQTSQSSVIYYSDGKTVLAKVGATNRTDVSIADVPITMQHAVVAAENRSFYTDPGVSVKGIGRALWADVRGQDVQGGSTITQQYAKNAFLSQERSVTRKAEELGIAIKLGRRYSKSQILEWYLNTIYFGRGAYGIQAAAQTYFGRDAAKLTLAQSAVLASSIRSPALYDPQDHRARAVGRWHYVLAGMQSQGWLGAQAVASAKYPKVLPPKDNKLNDLAGPKGYIVARVEQELAEQGISEDQLRRSGLRVTTTIDKRAQDAAVSSIGSALDGQPAKLRTALVSVEPKTGAVRAYYGGKRGYGYLDYAAQDYQSGSSIKAFVLATALEQGISLNSVWDGSSPQTFPQRPNKPVYNSGDAMGEQCPQCSLWKATAKSLNTVYYALTVKVGAAKAAILADAAGIHTLNGSPTSEIAPKISNDFGIGEYEVTPLDMADGFATFGDAGVQHDPYFVSRVTRNGGQVLYSPPRSNGTRAFSGSVAGDADWALQKVITQEARGGRYDRRLTGPEGQYRPAGAKTGTTQLKSGRNNLANKDAWFTGYTPQLATAVWVGHDSASPLVDAEGRDVYGIGLPGAVWQAFNQAALAGSPVQQFPQATFGGLPDSGTVAGSSGSAGSGGADAGTRSGTSSTPDISSPGPINTPTQQGSPSPDVATSSPPSDAATPLPSSPESRPPSSGGPGTLPASPPAASGGAGEPGTGTGGGPGKVVSPSSGPKPGGSNRGGRGNPGGASPGAGSPGPGSPRAGTSGPGSPGRQWSACGWSRPAMIIR